jgi:hypothetical protein
VEGLVRAEASQLSICDRGIADNKDTQKELEKTARVQGTPCARPRVTHVHRFSEKSERLRKAMRAVGPAA